MANTRVTILGSGTSHGIPVVGCSCSVCRSADPRDNRYRSAIYVEGDAGEKIVVDTGPEFRLQALRADITELDAVLFTHHHADHLHGIDDLRPLTFECDIPIYANKLTLDEISRRFSYIWSNKTPQGGGLPHLKTVLVEKRTTRRGISIGNIKVLPIRVTHGAFSILGWKFKEGEKRFVYITDASKISIVSYLKVMRCHVLVIGALRMKPHVTHFSFEQALHFAKKIYWSPEGRKYLQEVYLTHICHNHSHEEIANFCAKWSIKNNMSDLIVAPAYDMMKVEL